MITFKKTAKGYRFTHESAKWLLNELKYAIEESEDHMTNFSINLYEGFEENSENFTDRLHIEILPPKNSMIGDKHPMYGKHHTEEAKVKMSIAHTSKKIHSEQEKIKRKEKWSKEKNPNYIYIDKDQLLTHIKNGLNNQELSLIFKCRPATIIEKIKQYFNIKPSMLRTQLGVSGNRKSEYKPIDFLLLTELIKSGKFRKDIAKELKVSEPQLNLKIKNKYGFGFTQLKQEIKNGNI